jgi:phosphotransferase system enzyme I (PtsI)
MSNPPPSEKIVLKGVPASPGIIIGKAHLVDRSRVKILYQYLIGEDQVNREVERFQRALDATEAQLVELKNRMPERIKDHSFILDSHVMIIHDSMLKDATVDKIKKQKINSEWALKKSFEEVKALFDEVDDYYIRGRLADVENVTERILRNLSGNNETTLSNINGRVIIVAHDLSPADTSEINISRVMGFITDVGGRTSHTAIMAQALEIPAVVGLESATRHIREGDLLIVDGNSGQVIISPDEDDIIAYQERQLRHEQYKSLIARTSHLPAVTLDGRRISIMANIEFQEEVAAAKDSGADGIGLYRTEFLYLRSKGLPSEEELFEDYRDVVQLVAPLPVTIRTFDLGGDKFVSDLKAAREMNPALGLRAIRFCLKEPRIFKSQLRAILRASAFGNSRLMFPMISGIQEVLDAKALLREVMAELDRERVAYNKDIKVGIMIEVPSAVAMAEFLAEQVDFFSIGTNDLIQYALAIDRANEHVAGMYQPFHPAILRMIRQVVVAARQAGIGVSLCGEMAGDPLCTAVLLGLGITELSMNARMIPIIKKIVRSASCREAEEDLAEVMRLKTAQEVRSHVLKSVTDLVPELGEEGILDLSGAVH